MACTYQVVIDGEIVWEHETEEYEGLTTFPANYVARPESGAVHLIVNGETIGIQVPLEDLVEAAILADAPDTITVSMGE